MITEESNREALLGMLTGIDASKLSYYGELKEKLRELEINNQRLREAKRIADELYQQGVENAKELASLYQKSKIQAERLDRAIQALKRISQVLTTTTQGMDVLVQSVVRTAAELFDTEYAVMTLGEGENVRQVVYCAYGLPTGPVPAVPPQEMLSLVDKAAKERRAALATSDRSGDVAMIVCTPMFHEGSLVGNICLRSRAGCDFTESDLSILQTLANQAATAIENARLFEESERMQAVTRRLYEMALQQKEEAERKTRELNQARQELSQMQKEQILTVERNRIARELHDNVAQILTSIGLNVEWCRQQVPGNSSLHQRLLWLKQLARNGIYEVRNAIFELSGVTILESGLVQALGNIAAEFERITGIEAGYSVEGTVRRLPTEAETALYRVAQEALYNIFKHAGATHVQLQIAFSQGEVSMEVRDDGVGIAEMAIQRCRQGLTFGLKSMQGRMEDLGGTLEILNLDTDGRGTRIIARISDQEVKDGSHPSSLG